MVLPPQGPTHPRDDPSFLDAALGYYDLLDCNGSGLSTPTPGEDEYDQVRNRQKQHILCERHYCTCLQAATCFDIGTVYIRRIAQTRTVIAPSRVSVHGSRSLCRTTLAATVSPRANFTH